MFSKVVLAAIAQNVKLSEQALEILARAPPIFVDTVEGDSHRRRWEVQTVFQFEASVVGQIRNGIEKWDVSLFCSTYCCSISRPDFGKEPFDPPHLVGGAVNRQKTIER